MFSQLVIAACCVASSLGAYNGPLAGGQPAALYPAGVDPKACPNFPDCTNPSVAVNQIPEQPQYAPQPTQYSAQPNQYQQPAQYQPQYQQPAQYQPQYQQPTQFAQQPARYAQQTAQFAPNQYQQPAAAVSPAVQNALDKGEYIGDGDYHGEGLAESLAPGYEAAQPAYASQQRAFNPEPSYNPQPSYYNPQPSYNQNSASLPGQYRYNQAGSHGQPAQIPAGVDPNSCPNYPFCS